MSENTELEQLRTQVRTLATQLDELTQRLDQKDPSPETQEEPSLLFVDVEQWVHVFFLPVFAWRADGQRWYWCPQWWQHAEAIWRLELLWRSFEAARLDPTGMSAWSVELDRHLRELLGAEGPFRQCRPDDRDRAARHTELEPPTAEPAPPGWWTETPEAPS